MGRQDHVHANVLEKAAFCRPSKQTKGGLGLDVSSQILSSIAEREIALDKQVAEARAAAQKEVEQAEQQAARILQEAQEQVRRMQAEHDEKLSAEAEAIRQEAKTKAARDSQEVRDAMEARLQQAAQHVMQAVLP